MMDHMTYPSKSPEKSSPSFPEDVEDDDEDPIELSHHKYPSGNDQEHVHQPVEQDTQVDVTMLPEDDEDAVGHSRGFILNVDSPRHPTDSSDKKVHWSNQNVQTLLDCVEKHLDEFNVQKKHKQVWQTIGIEMESLGFTMEHCYNKWKNLRRDVRLLVNNPQKAVRNADILRRVARLILVIYPNIDATTMQVSGDRMGGKSTPNTPGGPVSLPSRVTLSSALHAPDSPLYYGMARSKTPHSLKSSFHSFTPNGVKHKSEQMVCESSVPGTALFTNLRHTAEKLTNNADNLSSSDINHNSNSSGFPFFFNPAAAALLVQSQLFNDLLRQQQHNSGNDESLHLDSVQQREQLFATATIKSTNDPLTQINNMPHSTNDECSHENGINQTVSLASALLNGLTNMDSTCPVFVPGKTLNSPTTDRFPGGSELADVVERLRNEENVHMRLTDMVTHLADELRAAGMRRRATLDQLLEIMQGPRLPSLLNQTAKASDSSHRV